LWDFVQLTGAAEITSRGCGDSSSSSGTCCGGASGMQRASRRDGLCECRYQLQLNGHCRQSICYAADSIARIETDAESTVSITTEIDFGFDRNHSNLDSLPFNKY
jgi:hypothetical protein